jgi:hypothetical protein
VGPRAVLDAVVKRKIPSSRRKSNPRTPIVQPVAVRFINCFEVLASIALKQCCVFLSKDEKIVSQTFPLHCWMNPTFLAKTVTGD